MTSKHNKPIPIISVVGTSGTGKTTFLEKLIPELIKRGLKVATVKHHKGTFEMDRRGKDTWRHKQAGAAVTLLSSPFHIGMVRDVDHDHGPDELRPFLTGVDIILTEGYKGSDKPKLAMFRPGLHAQPILRDDKNLLALVSDTPFDIDFPGFSADDDVVIADFLIRRFELNKHASALFPKVRKA